MSVRVNLLPTSVTERNHAARQKAVAGAAAGIFLLGLGGIYALQTRNVNDAKDQLAAEQMVASSLRSDLSQLAQFQELDARIGEADAFVRTGLGAQVSIAGILQDLALVMPPDTAVTSLSVNAATAGEPEFGPNGPVHGSVALAGESLTGHAPGVERVMLSLDKAVSFQDVYFTSTTIDASAEEAGDEDNLSVFSLDFTLGPTVLTRRYDGGIPEEQR